MLDGINILQEHFCRKVTLSSVIFTSILVISLAVLYISILRFGTRKRLFGPATDSRSFKIFAVVSSVVLVCLVISCILTYCRDYLTTWYEYSVTVNDSVGFNEFFDKYEIVSQDGDIYRIKEIIN